MEKLQSQVLLARRRLATQQFMDCLTWALPALMLVAALAVATPKVWVLGFEPQQSLDWVLWWSGSCAVAAFAFAGLWVWAVRRKPFEAAVEIDRRFGLRERISSAWSLGDQERETEVGRALVGDASRRIERIDVREQFRVRMGWPVLLTVLPIAAIVLLTTLVDDAVAKPGNTPADTPEVKKQVKKSAESLKKKIEERRKQATKEGLKDAAHLFKKLEEGADKLAAKSDVDRKQAMVELNDLAKQIKDRRQKLGGSEQVKKQLNQLKDMKKGPADKIAKAVQEGDFGKALDEVKKLADKLESGEMSDEERQKLAGQLNDMKDKLQQMPDQHEAAKQQLEQQIKQAAQQGDNDRAGKLQQQLDNLRQSDSQMDRLQDLANKLGQCQQCMEQGDQQGAAQQLSDLAGDLEQMQQELDELEALDGALEQIADAKNAMKCGSCGGTGCEQCQAGMGQGQGGAGKGQDGPPGVGMGEGQGAGERPEEASDTKFYDSQVRANPGRGEAVIVDNVPGPNIAGQAREEIKNVLEASRRESAKPLTGQQLPKAQREHTKQYFESFVKEE